MADADKPKTGTAKPARTAAADPPAPQSARTPRTLTRNQLESLRARLQKKF